MKIFGLIFFYLILLIGAFLALDAFIPKSKSVSFHSMLIEFIIGVVVLFIAYFFIRKIRRVGSNNSSDGK